MATTFALQLVLLLLVVDNLTRHGFTLVFRRNAYALEVESVSLLCFEKLSFILQLYPRKPKCETHIELGVRK